MSSIWHVAYTKPLQEKKALFNLTQQNFKAFFPQYQKRCRHARRVQMRSYPLFPRYLFVQLNQNASWHAISSTRGISYLLTDPGTSKPIPLQNTTIEDLLGKEDEEGNVPLESLALFEVGEQLRIKEGPFADQIVTYEGMDEAQRVNILLKFMEKEVKLQLPIYALDKV